MYHSLLKDNINFLYWYSNIHYLFLNSSFLFFFTFRMTKLYDYPKHGCPFRKGKRYFYYHNTGLQNQRWNIFNFYLVWIYITLSSFTTVFVFKFWIWIWMFSIDFIDIAFFAKHSGFISWMTHHLINCPSSICNKVEFLREISLLNILTHAFVEVWFRQGLLIRDLNAHLKMGNVYFVFVPNFSSTDLFWIWHSLYISKSRYPLELSKSSISTWINHLLWWKK